MSAVIHMLDHSVIAPYWLYVVAKLGLVVLISGYPCHVKGVGASKADDLVLVQDGGLELLSPVLLAIFLALISSSFCIFTLSQI